MTEGHALPDLISRVKIDSSGVDAAMNSLIGSFGRTNLALAGVAAGIGLLIAGGKSMIEIAEKHERAMLGLEQAYEATGTNLDKYQGQIDAFIRTNRRYLTDQSEVIDSYAKLTRSGLTQEEVQKDMSRAVDLAAIKHISLSEAVDLLVKAEQGRLRGLIDLGISTGKYTDAQGDLINGTKDVSRVMDELDPKLKDGRQSISEFDQATNSMGITWQKFSLGPGKELHRALTNAVQIGDLLMQFLEKMGSDNQIWDAIGDRLIKMATWIHDYLLKPLQDVGNWINQSSGGHIGYQAPAVTNDPISPYSRPRASGGPVLPNSIYTVGERGPETLVMGPSGGMVLPNSGVVGGGSGGNVNINVAGPLVHAQTNADAHDIAVDAAWELRKMRRNY